MSGPSYPKLTSEVVETLADIFRHQRREEIVELLENSKAHFSDTEYDNWNGGTTTWELRIEVPISIFAVVEPKLSAVEKEITSKLGYFNRLFPNDPIGSTAILPIAPGSSAAKRLAPSDIEVKRLWQPGKLRLFLSHVSKYKLLVSRLKEELRIRGVTAFVAHEDIEPSSEWRREIELALRSMHALSALLTKDFHDSTWTDQEVGWAMGRGVLVVPVRLGVDPYGLAGKYQGLSGTLEQPDKLASTIAGALLINSSTSSEMRSALVHSFVGSDSYIMTLALLPLISEVTNFSDEQKESLRHACTDNLQVANAYNASETIYKLFGNPLQTKREKADNEIPF